MGEPAVSTLLAQDLHRNRDYSLWGMFFFAPFYMAYKGFLKEGLVFGLATTLVSTLIVDFVIQPTSENFGIGLTQAINGIFYLIAAFKWDDYLTRWNSQSSPNKLPKLVNLFIAVFLVLAAIICIALAEGAFYESQLETAKSLEKNGQSNEALGMYFNLCRKNTAEACLSAGLTLADSKMFDKAIKYWARGCKLDSADACYVIGLWTKDEGKKDASKKYLEKACRLGKADACTE